jgi:hypothetical protein
MEHDVYHTDKDLLSNAFSVGSDDSCYHIDGAKMRYANSEYLSLVFEHRPLLESPQSPDVIPCNKANVIQQLQTALRLEWATLPPYLTTLYTTDPTSNSEIYSLIQSIVLQEMLHFALVGNMLISLGAVPKC